MSVKSKSGRAAAFGAVVVAGALLVGGCGGGSDSDSEPLTKDEFIAQADEICADFSAQAGDLKSEFLEASNAGDTEKAASLFEEQADKGASAIDQIEALEVPEGDQATIDEFISYSREQIDAIQATADAIRANDKQALDAAVAKGDAADSQSDQVADAYGFVDCGSAGDDS